MNLLAHRFFSYFSEARARALAEYASDFFCDEKTVLFNEGDPSDQVFLLLEGKVDLVKRVKDGKDVTIASVDEGGYFGEMGILDDKPRSAAAVAATFVHVAKIPSTVLLRTLNEEPAYVTIQLLKTVLDHLRESNDRYVEEIAKRGGAL